MPKWFTDVTKEAETGRKAAVRAQQAWQYLIAKATNRQIVRYKELRQIMEYRTDRPLRHILGCIMYYCEQNNLPPLTLLVVNKSGIPGAGFTAERLEDYHQRREDVFNFSWYRMVPPTVREFHDAHVQGGKH